MLSMSMSKNKNKKAMLLKINSKANVDLISCGEWRTLMLLC